MDIISKLGKENKAEAWAYKSWSFLFRPDGGKLSEGSCGYGKDGKVNPRDTSKLTPGGLKSMPADKRTTTMMREVIRKEIKKLSEEGSLDKNLKGEFSPEEWDKITSKPVPSFADFKSKGHEVAPIMKQIFKKRK
jgi:hypothetical protein